MKFAKLFELPRYGQVLLKFDADDEGKPELRWYVQPPELGVCSIAVSFNDTDQGWDQAETAFDSATDEHAEAAAKGIYSAVGA